MGCAAHILESSRPIPLRRSRSFISPVFIAFFFLIRLPTAAPAQTENVFAVGISGGLSGAPGDHVDGHPRLGPLVRLGAAQDGWRWKVGFNWYGAELEQDVGGSFRSFGRLRVRPIMAGYGYTRVFGRVSGTVALLGGFGFSSFRLDEDFADLYRASTGVASVRDDVSNPFVLKPEVSVWVDLDERFGLNFGGGYMISRPSVTLQSPGGDDRRNIHADVFILSAGLVYSVF
jgi:hypothetical protein